MLRFLTEEDVRACLTEETRVLEAVAQGVLAFADGQAKSFPSVSMAAEGSDGAIYTIRGMLEPQALASVKTVGSFPNNRQRGLPPDPGLLTLIDAQTGVPKLVAEASYLTTLRTAAMAALGAHELAREGARIIGCIGARGIAPLAARMIAGALEDATVKVHSRSVETRAATARALEAAGCRAEESDSWDACVAGSDIVIDGAGLSATVPLLRSDLIAPGALVISYGAYCSLDDDITDRMDQIIVDRWDPAPTGAMGRLIAEGRMTEEQITAYFGDVLSKRSTGRRSSDERILFWHRGIGACDIALAAELMAEANVNDLGIRLK